MTILHGISGAVYAPPREVAEQYVGVDYALFTDASFLAPLGATLENSRFQDPEHKHWFLTEPNGLRALFDETAEETNTTVAPVTRPYIEPQPSPGLSPYDGASGEDASRE